ncbi:MAG: CHASE domain-containing protein [Pyrinomonadaceae bacterium]|nr:CHASE domain-containing protein [Pyrinomonadaceae bacterium]
MGASFRSRTEQTWRAWTPYFVLATTMLLTVVAMYYVAAESEARDRLRFENSVRRTQDNIQNRIENYIAMLRAGSALFAASENVTRDEFRIYVERLGLQGGYAGIRGIGYSARVLPQEREALINSLRAQGVTDFKIWPEHERAEYHSIIYLEPPDERNRRAIGFDMFTETVRRTAMERARDSGEATATGRVTLIQEMEEPKQAGVLIYVPVYQGGAIPTSEAERREKLKGFIYAPFRAGDLLEGIFGSEKTHEVGFKVFDEAASNPDSLLYDSEQARQDSSYRPRFTATTPLRLAGRTWYPVFATEPQFDHQSGRNLLPYILLVGGMVSLVLFGITRSEVKARILSGRAAKEVIETEQRAVREYERLLVRITSLAQALGGARDLQAIYSALREFTITSVPAVGIFVSLYDPKRDVRTAAYAWGEGADVDVSRLPPMPISKDGPNSRAVRSGEVIITDDYMALMRGHPTVKVGVDNGQMPQSSLVVPMAVMGRIVGTIEVQSYELAAYREEHVTAMRMAANLAAVAIENVQLIARERRARAAAEDASRMKDEFLATVSHELRTPLTSMLGWTYMLRSTDLDEAGKVRALETIERNAKLQTQIVDDILDVSRIVTGKMHMDVQQIDLNALIESAINAVRPAAEAKEIKIEKRLEAGSHLISGDANRLQQVFWNLFSNAVKFTTRGGLVGIQMQRVEAHVEIKVTDTGQGIGKEFLPYVFDRFRQADSSTTRRHGGLGLGLAIVRHLVEMHGGTVEAASEGEGMGATFTLTLPIAAREAIDDREAQQASLAQQKSSAPLKGLHILVVDDEPDAREMLRAMLERDEAKVTTAASAHEALEVIEAERPDVLISDIGMPIADGYDLLRELRRVDKARGKHLPAIALTAYAREEDRERSLAEGFEAFFSKPTEPAELIKTVAQVAAQVEKTDAGAEQS